MSDDDVIDITGLDIGKLVIALVNNAKVHRLGFVAPPRVMTLDEADEAIAEARMGDGLINFDYVAGRPIKVIIEGAKLRRADLYDRDNGRGACERIVAELRAQKGTIGHATAFKPRERA